MQQLPTLPPRKKFNKKAFLKAADKFVKTLDKETVQSKNA